MGAVGVSKGAMISVHTRAVVWHFALSSAPRDELDTFVGASPRRGTGVWKEIIYVAGEERVPLCAERFCRGDECNVLAHASNTTTGREPGWRPTIRPALSLETKAIVWSPAGATWFFQRRLPELGWRES